MFKALSRPLPDLKDWRFSIDQRGIAWAVFDREGESQNSLGRRPLEELAQIVATVEEGARDKTHPRPRHSSPARRRASSSAPTCASSPSSKPSADVIENLRPVDALSRSHRGAAGAGRVLPSTASASAAGSSWRSRATTASPRATTARKLGFPEVKLGIFPGFNGTARSIRQAGAPAAMQVMLTGKMLSALRLRAPWASSTSWSTSRGALALGGAQGRAAQAQVQAGADWRRAAVACGRRATCSPSSMRAEIGKKAREDHYPAPFRLIDLFERYGGNDEAHEGRRDARLRAADGVGAVAQSAPRVQAVGDC